MKNVVLRILVSFILMLTIHNQLFISVARADEKTERIQALQEKMVKLKSLLAELEEQKLREQPPQVIPWQPLTVSSSERRAYSQYVYLLAPQMSQTELSASLEQLYLTAAGDKLTKRGTLFVVPSLAQNQVTQLSEAEYNRSFAADMLSKIGLPGAISGGMLVTEEPLGKAVATDQNILFVDLANCSAMLRAQIFEQLLLSGMHEGESGLYSFIGSLVSAAQPQTFHLYQQQRLVWFSAAE